MGSCHAADRAHERSDRKTVGGQIRMTRPDIANGDWWRRVRGADGRQRGSKLLIFVTRAAHSPDLRCHTWSSCRPWA